MRGEEISDFACRFVNKNGKTFDLMINTNRVSAVRGGEERYMQVLRDVTKLHALEKAKDEFLLIVSHELRNPLQVLKGLNQLFRLKLTALDLQDKMARHLEMMDSQINQIANLVEDILTAYRLQAGRFNADFWPIDLMGLIADVAAPFTMSAPHHPIEIDFSEADAVMVYGDTQRLQEILSNLFSNAIKYSPEGGVVSISCERNAGTITVYIDDSGVGIPKDHLERVFEGFHRVGQLSEWQSGGLGLGLYISRRLARMHGGDLWAENRPKGGTRMCLRLPVQMSKPSG